MHPNEELDSHQPPPRATSNPAKKVALVFALAVVSAAASFAWSRAQPKAREPITQAVPSVGVEASFSLALDRGDLSVAPITATTPLLLRITAIRPTGDGQFTYELHYSGVEKGTFNLTDYLQKPDGSRLREPVSPVAVTSVIPEGAVYAITNMPPDDLPEPKPYGLILLVFSLLWVGCGMWLFLPFVKRRLAQKAVQTPLPPEPEPEPAPKTLAELLRPLVEKAAKKAITTQEKARMEQILFVYWGAHLELDHLSEVEQLRRILAHEEAGALLRKVEQWLYQPNSAITAEEIAAILQPYMELPIPETTGSATENTESAPPAQAQ